jgi:hypothetical protein
MQGAVSSSPWPPDENSDPRQKLSVAGHPVTAFVRCDRHFSTDLCPGTHTSDAKRIYRTLALDGYARIDFRLSAESVPYFLDANPNPEIAEAEEFARAAMTASNTPPCSSASSSSASGGPKVRG